MRVKSGSFIPFSVPMTILMWEASKPALLLCVIYMNDCHVRGRSGAHSYYPSQVEMFLLQCLVWVAF